MLDTFWILQIMSLPCYWTIRLSDAVSFHLSVAVLGLRISLTHCHYTTRYLAYTFSNDCLQIIIK